MIFLNISIAAIADLAKFFSKIELKVYFLIIIL